LIKITTKSIINGDSVAVRNDQNIKELVKISLKILLLKKTPTNKDLEKSVLGKNNNPKISPLVIKTKDLNG
jgi:hypothetical protein